MDTITDQQKRRLRKIAEAAMLHKHGQRTKITIIKYEIMSEDVILWYHCRADNHVHMAMIQKKRRKYIDDCRDYGKMSVAITAQRVSNRGFLTENIVPPWGAA